MKMQRLGLGSLAPPPRLVCICGGHKAPHLSMGSSVPQQAYFPTPQDHPSQPRLPLLFQSCPKSVSPPNSHKD